MPITGKPPGTNDVEISLFGPGVGESICVHIGKGKWIVVDSCKNPATSRPAVLEYFETIGVDPSTQVVLIIVTHWHSDHIAGMPELIAASSNAQVIMSTALMDNELVELKELVDAHPLPAGVESGLSDFSGTIELLAERVSQRGEGESSPFPWNMVNGDQRVFSGPNGVNVTTLSPSPAAVIQSKLDVRALQRAQGRRRGVIPPPSSNLNAIALWIEAPAFNILLGSDLEVHVHQDVGWHAVLNSISKPRGKAKFFKIPHHGSITGHHAAIWNDMVHAEPIALLTEYRRSKLPNKNDITRLRNLANSLFMTTVTRSKPKARTKVVERLVKSTVKDRVSYPRGLGHVQLRIDATGEYEVEMNTSAIQVQ